MMPSLKCLPGDTICVRATVIEACSDAFQVVVDDGTSMAITCWVPVSECARHEDVHLLKPPRRRTAWHRDRG